MMQVLTGLVVIFGFFLEIWDIANGIDICQEAHPPRSQGVNICTHPIDNYDSLNMDCGNDSIAIQDVFIGSKEHNTQCHDHSASTDYVKVCCTYEQEDLLFDSKCPALQNSSGALTQYVYADTIPYCSGRSACVKKLSYVFPLPSGRTRDFADYARVVYNCEPEPKSIGFCESRTVTGRSVTLRYDKSFDSQDETEHECSCHVTTSSSEPIKITALDVRLQDATDKMECHYTKLGVVDSADKSQIYKNIYCVDKEYLFGIPVLNSMKSKDFRITLGPIKEKEYPSFVWLKVEGKTNQSAITIQCSGPTTENPKGMMPEAIVIAVICTVILSGIIVTIVALCKHRRQREYKPPQPENIYFELETPEEKYDQIHLKQLSDTTAINPDPSYGRLNYSPDESHYAEPDKLNGKPLPPLDNHYATPDLCRS